MKSFLRLMVSTYVIALMMSTLSSPVLAQVNTAAVVSAADKFLATLSTDQRQKVLYAYDDAAQRARWSNFPTGFVPRGGINLKQMNAPQRDAAMKLLATVLSPMGLEKVNEIRQADDDFKLNGSKRGPGGRGGPPPGPPPGGQNGPPPQSAGPGARAVKVRGHLSRAMRCLEAICTTSHFSVSLQQRIRGCFSLADIILR